MLHDFEMWLIQASLPVCGWVGTHYVGKMKYWGWHLQVLGQLIWITYAIATNQFGLPFGTIGYLFLYLKNGNKWRKGGIPRVSEQGPQIEDRP